MYTRRAALRTAVTGVVGSVAGCLHRSGSASSEFKSQLDRVRSATRQYTDHTRALQDGFKPAGPFVPGMGWHLSHPNRIKDAAKNGFSLETPQVLVYDTAMNLGAVEWAAPKSKVEQSPDLFADEGSNATEEWHSKKAATHVLAVPDGQQTKPDNIPLEKMLTNSNWAAFHPPDPDLEEGDTVVLHWGSGKAKQASPKEERTADLVKTLPELTTLHAWVHAENPEGVLAPMNPEFAQSMGTAAGHH